MTWHDAIVKVLRESGSAMHYTEITDRIVDQQLVDTVGATPTNTVNAQITTDIRDNGDDSTFVRVRRGEYMLREHHERQSQPSSGTSSGDEESDSEASGEESGIIQAFGMYWQRSKVRWTSSPSLLGQQNQGAEPVDFGDQRGVYLLHDRRSTIYVGRSIKRPIGRRLYEHTKDRLNGRWDRFSWFGILGVTDEGALVEDVSFNYDRSALIATLEALLVESVEPPQNRQRGEGFRAVEYLQTEDPEMKNQRLASLIDEIRDNFVG
jgi:hypothetical protein